MKIPSFYATTFALYCTLSLFHVSALVNPIEKVGKDLKALTRRVTAHHILLPPKSDELAVALKSKIRQQCIEKDKFVIDVFEEAARKYSQDETTNFRGGLIGELVPQGYCRSRILDRACFQEELGKIEGPIESEFGCHLLLISERTNCPALDGEKTKLAQMHGSDVFGTLVPSRQVGRMDNFVDMIGGQITFWLAICLAGGLLAESVARLVPV